MFLKNYPGGESWETFNFSTLKRFDGNTIDG